jgi:hypothetical protein
MGVGTFSRLLRGVGVPGMPDAGLNTMRHIESVCMIPLGTGVLRLLSPGVAVGVIIGCHCVVGMAEVTH